jgi:hypothetical protein
MVAVVVFEAVVDSSLSNIHQYSDLYYCAAPIFRARQTVYLLLFIIYYV